MKSKIYPLIFLSLCLMAQSRIPVSKLVGTWYLDKISYDCQDLRCTGEGYDFYSEAPSEKLRVYVKDSHLVFSSYDPQSWALHYEAPTEFVGFMGEGIQADTSHLIKNDSITSLSIRVTDSTLVGGFSLHGPGLLYSRDSLEYLQDILLKHSWKSTRCMVHEDGGFCPEENFYRVADTLVYKSQFEGPIKFLYNTADRVYEDTKYKDRKLKIVNDSVLALDNYQLVRVKTSARPIADLAAFQGKWLSTTRPDVFVEVANYNVSTNSTRTYMPRFRDERPYVYLEETALPSGYGLSFHEYKSESFSRWTSLPYDTVPIITCTLDNATFVPDEDLVGGTFIHKPIRLRFMFRNKILYNMSTGEMFSKVVGFFDEQKANALQVWPNPCQGGTIHLGVAPAHYQVLSPAGIVLEQGFSTDGKVTLQSSKPGMYLLKVQSKQQSHTSKLYIID